MNRWDQHLHRHRREKVNPSFSSSLLDSIYRSIDEADEQLIVYRETSTNMKKKQSIGHKQEDKAAKANFQRACLIEKWMEKKGKDNVVNRKSRDSVLQNSSSSSSDSSSGSVISSNDLSVCYNVPRPRPIRTSVPRPEKPKLYTLDHYQVQSVTQRPKQEGSFVKTKSKAVKIYGDLKKVKQPISPGGRLASFLNSIFTVGTPKKAKISSDGNTERKSMSANTSTCSSASSFSRSCLSSARGQKLSNGAKRSVRFCPVSVIVDEDCRPCGHKSVYENKPNLTVKASVEEARDMLKNYQKKIDQEEEEEDDDDDDGLSCSSSDLFELDNLSAGIERYREELPVYETTHFGTNRVIAKGLIL